jgi:hypothetical protein
MRNQLTPDYLSSLCPREVGNRTNYNLRNAGDTDIIHSNKNYFLKSFLPSTVKLWNELPHELKTSNSLNTFKEKLFLHFRMITVYKPYLSSPNKNYIHLARLRMGLSALNAHRRKYHFIQNAACNFCPREKEDTLHFLLLCPHYTAARTIMLNSLANTLPESHQHLLQLNTKQKQNELSKVMIFGINNPEVDLIVFEHICIFIETTGRFI